MSRLEHLDLLRIVSVVLVIWGYFVSVGGVFPNFINHNLIAPPLMDTSKWRPKLTSALADLVYRFYLTHVAIGLVTMVFVCEYICQQYNILLSTILNSLQAPWLLNRFIEKHSINFGMRFTKPNLKP